MYVGSSNSFAGFSAPVAPGSVLVTLGSTTSDCAAELTDFVVEPASAVAPAFAPVDVARLAFSLTAVTGSALTGFAAAFAFNLDSDFDFDFFDFFDFDACSDAGSEALTFFVEPPVSSSVPLCRLLLDPDLAMNRLLSFVSFVGRIECDRDDIPWAEMSHVITQTKGTCCCL